MDTSPRVLVVSTLTDGNLCSSQCERRRNAGVFNFNFLFSRKLLYCWHGIFWDNLLHLQIWFRIFFNWWHSPFAWWHSQELISKNPSNKSYNLFHSVFKKISGSSSHFHYCYQILRRNESANYICNQFRLAIKSGNTTSAISHLRQCLLSLFSIIFQVQPAAM